MKFTYTDHDERGGYRADVENEDGQEVFTIRAGDELEEDETSIFEDGFMENSHDMEGLERYLRDLGIIQAGDTIQRA